MAILVYGLNQNSAPIEVRERLVVPEEDLVPAVLSLAAAPGIREGIILSTCNRTELIVLGEGPEARTTLRGFLLQRGRVTGEELDRHAYLHVDADAVRHLFRVAASLDSMVVGEPQILGQVKDAFAAAKAAGTVHAGLDHLVRRALQVAKLVRTATGIARSPVSIAKAAAVRAHEVFGNLSDRAVLIVGAGKMARLAAEHVVSSGVGSIAVVNRSYQSAADLARRMQGTAFSWDERSRLLEVSDVVIVSTGAPQHVLVLEEVQQAARTRRGRPLFLLDIALPRNVDPRVNTIDNVYLYDLDDLRSVADAGKNERRREAANAESMVEAEAEAYLEAVRALEVTPTIVALRERLHSMGAAEMERFRPRLGPLTPEQAEALEEFRTALLNKVLHHPVRALKRAGGRPGGGGLVAFLREAFGLDGDGPPRETP
jgi:glutamyl-tRNA reductase